MKLILLLAALLIALPIRGQEPNFQFTHKGSIYKIKFSPDGSKLLSYSSGNQDLCMWDVVSGKLLWKRPISFIQKADEYYTLNALAWSPDQTTIATGSGNGSVQLWDVRTGDFRWMADVGSGGVAAVAFSPTGKSIAATSYSDPSITARIFDLASGRTMKTFAGSDCERIAIGFDSNGDELRIGELHGGVSTWDEETAALRSRLGDCKSMYSYGGERAFSEDLSLSFRRTEADKVQIEKSDGTAIRVMAMNSSKFAGLINTKTRQAIKYEYGGYRLLDLDSGAEKLIDDCVSGSGFDLSQNGKLFAQSCGGFKTAIRVTNLETHKTSYLDGHPSKIHAIRYSPDDSLFAVAGNDGNAYLFESNSKSLIRVLTGGDKRLTSLAFMPDGKSLVTGDETSALHIWDISSGRRIQSSQLGDRLDDIENIEISRNGRHILVQINGSVSLVNPDLSVQSILRTTDGYESTTGNMTISYDSVPISSADFSYDSSKIITGHEDGTIRVWSSATGSQTKRFPVGDRPLFLKEINSKHHVVALVGDRNKSSFRLIDLRTGRSIKRSRDIDATYAQEFAASPDGRFAVVTDISGGATLCDLRTMRIRELPASRNSGSDSIAFRRDSRTFFIGGADQNLSLYDTLTLKRTWQLLPDFVPSEVERNMKASKAVRVKAISQKKKLREIEAANFIRANRKRVYIAFDHIGEMSDPSERRMVESPIPDEGKSVNKAGNAVWLKLHNDSSLPISVPTQSMYVPEKGCFHSFSNGEKMLGLCKDREISVWFSVEDQKGASVPYGYDFGSEVMLLPGGSVLFPVPRNLWEKDYAFVFNISFQNVRASENDHDMDFGETIELRTQRSSVGRSKL